MFVNRMPRFEILSEGALEQIDAAWKRIASDIGIRFSHPAALQALKAAGQRVTDEDVVHFDPEFVLEHAGKAPSEFTVHSRDPDKTVTLGGDHMVFACVGGPPFVRDGAIRRDGSFKDFEQFVKLTQTFDELDLVCMSCEPVELPLDSRHLDMLLAFQTLSTKPWMGGQTSPAAIEDSLTMAEIVFGSRDDLQRSPVMWAAANVNSPLHYDERMLDVMIGYGNARQPVMVTPFLLMGAMAPVSIPAALAQQLAEALTGIACMQLMNPGTPMIMGSFLSHTDMQSGSPGFGGPESALGLLCSGQIARRYGIPWRSGGGSLTSSQTPDAQAAYEGLNTLLPAFLSGANYVAHAAGWLESGLVACYEKFIIDIELVRVMQEQFTPLEIDAESFAFEAHEEVGHGSHFFGAEHTLARFRDCFYRPMLSSTENFDRWQRNGGKDAAARAADHVQTALAEYEVPSMDAAVTEELTEFVRRRRAELGD
jgi:trimethylamine---corrinoid protein Co-methyltransferase